MSARMGAGHDAAATAVGEAATSLWPGCELHRVDTLEAMGPGVGPAFRAFYVGNVRYTPALYQFYFETNWRCRWFAESSKAVVGAWAGPRLQRHLDAVRPDLVVSTYPLGSAGLAWLRSHGRLDVPVEVWVCDFAPHPFWVYDELDLHLVMHDVAVPPLREIAPTSPVRVAAPPVGSRFVPGSRSDARSRLGLPADGLVALVSCGSLGFGSVEVATRALLAADPSVTAVVVAGRNLRLRTRLEALARGEPRLRLLGWVDDMPALLHAADLVVTNAGGATSLEALATDTPVVMFQPIAAHGRANAEYMARAGLADVCDTPGELSALVRALRSDATALPRRRRRITEHRTGLDLTADVAAGWRHRWSTRRAYR